MTASQIVDEIKSLSPEEQAGVVRFVYQLDAERKLSGSELSALAERLVNADNPVEASRVRETIVRGFYGAGAALKIEQPRLARQFRDALTLEIAPAFLSRARSEGVTHDFSCTSMLCWCSYFVATQTST